MEKTTTARFGRDFVLMVIGQIVSIFGSAILRFALSTYVLDLTGRADIFALLFSVSMIPGIILSPVGGAIADRFNRRDLMVIFDFSSGAIVFAFAFVLFGGNATVLIIGVAMTLLSLISAIYQPAVQASIPVLVGEQNLATANGIVNGVGALASLIGPVLGGVLYAAIGIHTLVIISGVAFALSAIMEIFIRIPFVRLAKKKTIASDVKEGFRYIAKENRFILKIMGIAAALNMFLSPFFVVGAPYILRVTMAAGDVIYGISLGVIQFSGIVGALVVGLLARRTKINQLYRWLMIVGALVVPMAFFSAPNTTGLGFGVSLGGFYATSVPIVILITAISVYAITLVQRDTPNAMLGKVMAILMAVSQCAAPLGQVVYGALFERFSEQIYIPILFMAAATLAIAFMTKAMLKNENRGIEKEVSVA